ncbi:transcription-repair coupling factor [[Clostridium] colinum]|uniref:transcription-repair coupling factor n=1 Tax=[Clostridium] colinum TaxID=36835 RepID=UPI0020256DD9|nr:transcription-repair coupling factor [[Clostridium] colinum]
MNLFNDIIKENKSFNTIFDCLKNETNPLLLSNLLDSQKSHIIYSIAQNFNNSSLIICENELIAKNFYDDLKFFFKDKVFYYPSKDVVFYSADVKSRDIIKYRFDVIKNILSNDNIVIVLSIDALFDRLVKKDIFKNFILNFKIGDTLNIEDLSKKLVFMGYEKTSFVEGIGQFSVRGGIIDIFSPILENAFRIELWDDQIDSIRLLDSFSGRSIENIDNITIYPMRELVYEENDIQIAIKNLLAEFEKAKKIFKENEKNEELLNLTSHTQEVIEKLKTQKTFSGIDKYIQFFYEDNTTLLDYLDKNTIIYFDSPNRIREKANITKNEFLDSLKGRILKGEILPCQNQMIFDYDDILNFSKDFQKILLVNIEQTLKDFSPKQIIHFDVKNSPIEKNSLEGLYDELKSYKNLNYTIVFLASGTTRCERLEKEFNENNITSIFLNEEKLSTNYTIHKGIVYIVRGSLNKGFEYPKEKFVLFSAKELFGEEKKKKKTTKRKKGTKIESFTDLKIGDYVVHDNHGIAIFCGIEKMVTDGISKDYLKLGYEDDGILYVSVNQLDMIQKYVSGGSATPKINKLGGKQWSVAKAKAKKSIEFLAKDLVELYAKRQQNKGFIFSKDNIWQTEFEDSFPFEETDDQLNAIQDVKSDMESDKVMDRLICGDVGFGKTEVAIRAAFKAVQDKKQVVFLVPTTILAQQHYQTFSNRMKRYPINVDMLSRFRTPAQQKATIKGIATGDVDIVIGTHRILSKDIKFKDLGLIIIDEEQRFGVRHKEKLKALKDNVDVLTLSATPIPRTLHMSMTGIRDMSLLEDPPRERMPVQTYVLEYDIESIKNAINRELARGGQVYYLHNRVHNIEEETEKIQSFVPDAVVSFAHGQMSERELEKVMLGFMKNEINVLVCTTIIETGLDISNVNTIIINNADRMGLSQLYQLRGRVGRSNKTSFAYLMYKEDKILQETSEKRLQTIKEFTEFGSGFKIAMRDLEIRGAGNLLGSQQHGHMDIIGYEMYCKLLDQCVRELKGEEIKEFETLVDISINAYISNSYIENETQKLEMYKKIANIKTEANFFDIQDELEDRFGNLPKAVQNLLNIALMKSYANNLGVNKISQCGNTISIKFNDDNKVDIEKLKNLLTTNKNFSFNGTLQYNIKDNKEDFVNNLKDVFLFLI